MNKNICYTSLLIALLFFYSTSVGQQLKIISFNVWSGLDYHGFFSVGEYESEETREQRFISLLNHLRALDTDIIFLQEANPVSVYTNRLADSLGYDEIHHVCNGGIKFGPVGVPWNLKEGIAILAKPELELKEYDVWKLSGSFGLYGDVVTFHFDESIFALVGKIKINDTPLFLINTHLIAAFPPDSTMFTNSPNKLSINEITELEYYDLKNQIQSNLDRQYNEANYLIRNIEELPSDVPLILGGDLNATPNSITIQTITSSGSFFDSFTEKDTNNNFTWDPRDNDNIRFSTHLIETSPLLEKLSAEYDKIPHRIDYIFLNSLFSYENVINSKIVFNNKSTNQNISDHYGVLSEIDISEVILTSPKELNFVAQQTDVQFEALPILSYDTDVGFGYGAKAFLLNSLNNTESFDMIFFNSSKGERWYRLVASFPDFELRQGKEYPVALDLIVEYDKLVKNSFFGVGNNSDFDNREYYSKEFIDISLTASRGFSSILVGQFGLRYKSIMNSNFEDGNILQQIIPNANPAKVNYSSLFMNVRYDTRNSFINPSKGTVLQGEIEYSPEVKFNDVSFMRALVGIQYYTKLFYPTTVLATRLNFQGIFGSNLPVQVLLPLGGNQTLRGYPQDRFLDKVSALFNAELRFPIYWRFGGILGFDAGKVWNSLDKIDLRLWKTNPSIGIRFYMDTFIVRIDMGFGHETTGFYFNFGHMF